MVRGEKVVMSHDVLKPTPLTPFDEVPAGDYKFEVLAYESLDGSGPVFAGVGIPVTVKASETVDVHFSMTSPVDHIEIYPSALTLDAESTGELIITGRNAAGEAVLGEASLLRFTSTRPEVATVALPGTVTTRKVGGTTVIGVMDSESGASARATVVVRPLPSVAVLPKHVKLSPHQVQRFTATLVGSTNASVSWSVAEGAAGGSISPNGRYVAPLAKGLYHVVATSVADPRRKGTGLVAVGSGGLDVERYPEPLLRDSLKQAVEAAITNLVAEGRLPAAVADVLVEISDTKSPEHGDYACNFAMAASKQAGMNPRALGEALRDGLIAESIRDPRSAIRDVEVAGPGFLNFRLKPAAIAAWIPKVLAAEGFGHLENANPQRINVEFVSVNPNGPITIGSGRGAAFGSALCNVLKAAGNVVHREYYINDGVNSEQMRLFAESVKALAEGREVPEKGYKGDYVKDVAERLKTSGIPDAADVSWFQRVSQITMIERQRGDLEAFGVEFDTWFSEQSLHDRGIVADRIEGLEKTGVADHEPYRTKLKLGKGGVVEETIREDQPNEDEEDGEPSTIHHLQFTLHNTLWLRSTKFGDDMDRVLRRRDGRLTYIASDVAYHEDKLTRPENATKMITILGPDHHGYIGRLTAVVAALLRGPEDTPEANALALATAKEKLEVVIYQLVRFLKDGKPAPMRKRDGNIYELRDLIDELGKNLVPDGTKDEQRTTGRDVARFFYLMRSHDTTMDFDIDLATQQSDENPVFYAQYAHARICSVLRKASEEGSPLSEARAAEGTAGEGDFDPSLLTHPRELALVKKILDLPWEIERIAKDYGVHRLTTYAVELARAYHHFYDACRVIQADQPELTHARLALCEAARAALRSTFALLGVSAPERLERRAAA